MSSGNAFELQSFGGRSHVETDLADTEHGAFGVPWQDEPHRSGSVLVFVADESQQENAVWVGVDKETNCPCRASGEQDSVATFSVIKRRLGPALCMTVHRAGVLVNGLPALDFSVLRPRDSLVIAPGIHSYVTERVRPYVGTPAQELIGKKCPFCRIPVTNDTRIVTCRCGVVYHHETEASHGAIAEKDRLNCLSKIRLCMSCSRPVTLEEYLVWDPGTL
jgi:hypothetical protein